MRIIGFIALLITLFISLFRLGGADLTNNVLAIALMILLVILFSDLKEFNFWGLWGKKKEEKALQEVVGKEPISTENVPKVKKSDVKQAEQDVTHLMEPTQENFLVYAIEIEKQLRIAANVLMAQNIPSATNIKKIIKILVEKNLLNETGEKQIELIRWLKNMIIDGRSNEITQVSLQNGMQVAVNFYSELNNWLAGTSQSI